jgi:hypothetical protein
MTAPRRNDETISERAGRALAETFCLAFGITLILVGALGFLFGGTNFDTGGNVQGDEFLLFEVNGWHNLVHIASGLVLLAASANGRMSVLAAFGFGAVYAVVTIWGFIDGNDVFGLLPVNAADNFLHLGLTLAAFFAGFASRGLMARGERRREPWATRRPAV